MIRSSIAGPDIHLKQVQFFAGNQPLLRDVSVEFKAGHWYGIFGPNGSGKSTLIKTILGLNNHQGSVELHWPQSHRGETTLHGAGNIGYIPQSMPFDDSLPISVRDYLLMSLSMKPVWFKRGLPIEVKTALERINLAGKLERKIGELSGGERQRLMLATALLQDPGLLILDEPMTGLDKHGKQDSLLLLSEFKAGGGTILMIEHDWELITQYCDHTYWVEGTISEIEAPQSQVARNSHAFGSYNASSEALR